MIKQLIEKYEKQLVKSEKLSVECRDEKLPHMNAFHNGVIQALESVIKDLRELEGKEPAQLKTLVLCKRELFFQNSDSKRIHRVYPFTEREAKLLASMLGVEYMHV